MSKADYNKGNKISHIDKEIGISYDYCLDNAKECLKRNKFYNQIRKNLVREKIKNTLKKKSLDIKQLKSENVCTCER